MEQRNLILVVDIALQGEAFEMPEFLIVGMAEESSETWYDLDVWGQVQQKCLASLVYPRMAPDAYGISLNVNPRQNSIRERL